MIGYTCKYTPVELLAALGGQPAHRLALIHISEPPRHTLIA